MNMLAIETTGSLCSVSLDADGMVFSRSSKEGLRHLTSLIPMIDEVVAEAGSKPADLDVIAVSSGPGSFTGIRIGITTARALAQTIGIPVIKVPTLETFVYLPWTEEARAEGIFRILCPVFDARREQIYAGAYYLEPDGRIMTLVDGGAYGIEDFHLKLAAATESFRKLMAKVVSDDLADDKVVIEWMGDGAHLVGHENNIVQDARAVLRWASDHGRQTDYSLLEPIYMRKAEASRKLEEKLAQERAGKENLMPLMINGVVREALPDDVYGISVVERLSFGEPWLEQSIYEDLELPYSDYVVFAPKENPSFVAAYAGLHRIVGEGHITNIAVHPSLRRGNIGSATLTELIRRSEEEGIDSFTLEVRASDLGAVRFYESLGFKVDGFRKDYYVDPKGGREDALIMWRMDS